MRKRGRKSFRSAEMKLRRCSGRIDLRFLLAAEAARELAQKK
jgi:hypothetical protein